MKKNILLKRYDVSFLKNKFIYPSSVLKSPRAFPPQTVQSYKNKNPVDCCPLCSLLCIFIFFFYSIFPYIPHGETQGSSHKKFRVKKEISIMK